MMASTMEPQAPASEPDERTRDASAPVDPASSPNSAEAAAKAAWLAKLDAPTWGKAAAAVADVASDAARTEHLQENCKAKVSEACDELVRSSCRTCRHDCVMTTLQA